MDARSKLIDVAAFLDRVATGGGWRTTTGSRPCGRPFARLDGSEADRARQVLLTFSDPQHGTDR